MPIVRWLDGTLEPFADTLSTEEIQTILQSRCGRNQRVHLNNMDSSDYLCAIIVPERELSVVECEQVEMRLREKWNNDSTFEQFQMLLLSNRAIVAGGSIAAALHPSLPINDFDVYIHHQRMKPFLSTLRNEFDLKPSMNCCFSASLYDKSFFRQNHILLRIPFTHRQSVKVDVMIVPDEVDLVDVVSNFDLTFCETWWTGEKVFANDPDGLRRREGWLKPLYRQRLFVDLNPFTVARIRKYRQRGWKISLDPTGEMNGISFDDLITYQHQEVDSNEQQHVKEEEWAVRYMLRSAFDQIVGNLLPRHPIRTLFFAYVVCTTPKQYTHNQLVSLLPARVWHLIAREILQRNERFPNPWQFDLTRQTIFARVFDVQPEHAVPLTLDEREELRLGTHDFALNILSSMMIRRTETTAPNHFMRE